MRGTKKVSRRYSCYRNRRLDASRRNASSKKPHHFDNITEERTPTPSWMASSDDEYWDNGYNSRGHDCRGFSRSGFNKHGFRRSAYGPDGFNAFGFDSEGYNRECRNLLGLTRADYDIDSYDAYGLDCYGYDRQGLNKYGYSMTDYNAKGLDKYGYTSDGLYHGVPGTALVPLRHAMVMKGRGDPRYGKDLYGKLKEHANMVVVNAKLEQEKLISYQDLVTDLSLKWTAWTTMYALGLL